MGILDDIKNLEPISDKVFTNKDFIKIIDEIFKDVEKELKTLTMSGFNIGNIVKCYKQVGVGKFEFNKIKIRNMVITFNKKNKDDIGDSVNIGTNEINKDNKNIGIKNSANVSINNKN